MRLTFIGAAHEVTGSCTYLEACGKKILIDCGIEQGGDTFENCETPVSPFEIDAILLTHAHIDHSGLIPLMVAGGFNGPIYSTEATHRLCNIMLKDSAHIQELEAFWRNKRAKRTGKGEYKPFYTLEDAEKALKLFYGCSYGNSLNIFDGIKIEFSDAGHLLGSASIRITINESGNEKTVLFSGDLGNVDRPLINDPQKPKNADYVVIESTYGDRLHGERPDYIAQLSKIMNETFARGGSLIIPAFAIGRTQELLYLFRIIKEKNTVKDFDKIPVYVDSPLAVEATGIYKDNLFDYYDAETLDLIKNGIDPIEFDGLKLSVTKDESVAINFDGRPKIILAASGMCEAGRIRHHLKHGLWNENNTVLFVGYQAEGTLGRKLLSGEKTVTLFGEQIMVKAKIDSIAGISGHADRDMLLSWLGSMTEKPEKVFVNHGEDTVCDLFAKTVSERLGFPTVAPYSGDEFDLITGECVKNGYAVRVEKKTEGRKRSEVAFGKLMAAVRKLEKIAEESGGLSNKEIYRFTDRINDLCSKYEKNDRE